MDTPSEVAFAPLLLGGVMLMLLAAGGYILFLVIYQKRLLQQQLNLRVAEAAHQQQLLTAVIAAQEMERERIGRDLHDDIASSIAMAKMLVDRLASSPPADDATSLLDMAREVLSTAAAEVRTTSHNLYPAALARVGLAQSLHYLAEVCRRTDTLAVTLEVEYPHPLALAQELALYRICQELVHNALKHAKGATWLVIRLRQTGSTLTLAVEDDGCGFAPAAAGPGLPATTGVGLRSIGVRVQMLRARLHQRSVPGQGACISVEMDCSAAA